MSTQQVIAAIATPHGTGGIGVVRLSGTDALTLADRVLKLSGGKTAAEMEGYHCAYGRAFDSEGEIDEVVVSVFRAPLSFTGENVVEISAHGGVYLMQRLLRACCDAGARPAQAGEFTRRAFLNGKLDLTRAEAIGDLIGAQSKQAAKAALAARDGVLARKIEAQSELLLGFAAQLAAWIDYPDEGVEAVDPAKLSVGLCGCQEALRELLATYDTGRIIREGIETAIVGRPNVGKSTLMNLMAGFDRSIVSDIPGTTRDVVSDTVRVGDLTLILSDTAGIRTTDDPVEKIGVRLAEYQLHTSQLVLAVFDGSQPLMEDDLQVIDSCREAQAIAIINKNDLTLAIDRSKIDAAFADVISLSALEADGGKLLEEAIARRFALGSFDPGAACLANERQRDGVANAFEEVAEAIAALEIGATLDAVSVCVERAIDALLEITGRRAADSVVDAVFAKFCVGK